MPLKTVNIPTREDVIRCHIERAGDTLEEVRCVLCVSRTIIVVTIQETVLFRLHLGTNNDHTQVDATDRDNYLSHARQILFPKEGETAEEALERSAAVMAAIFHTLTGGTNVKVSSWLISPSQPVLFFFGYPQFDLLYCNTSAVVPFLMMFIGIHHERY